MQPEPRLLVAHRRATIIHWRVTPKREDSPSEAAYAVLTQAREIGVEELQDTITRTTVEHKKAAGAKEVAKAEKINKAIQSPETTVVEGPQSEEASQSTEEILDTHTTSVRVPVRRAYLTRGLRRAPCGPIA